MTEIKLICRGGTARARVKGVITAGMAGVPVTIACDESWDGLTRNLVAMTAAGRKVIDNVADEAVLPWEVLVEGMRLFIGLEGRSESGDIILPTEWADCGKVRPGTAGSHEAEPTPGEMEQLLNYALTAIGESKKALELSGTASEQAEYAYEQARNFEGWYEATRKNAAAAAAAVGKMQYATFELNEEGELVVKHPEVLGGTSFRLNYENGNLEVKL